jgi:transposase
MVVNGVFWRTRSGSPWRDLPGEYGNPKTVYNRHRRWSGDGTWVRVLDELRRGADAHEGSEWTVGVDAAVVRAHQHAAGARHAPPADVDAEVVAPTVVDTGGWVE